MQHGFTLLSQRLRNANASVASNELVITFFVIAMHACMKIRQTSGKLHSYAKLFMQEFCSNFTMKSLKITKLWEDFTFSDLLPFSQEFQLLEILTNIEN